MSLKWNGIARMFFLLAASAQALFFKDVTGTIFASALYVAAVAEDNLESIRDSIRFK